MALVEDLRLTQAILAHYVLPMCMFFGIIGSFLNLGVFCQKKFRSNSCSIYFVAGSIFNFLVILCALIFVVIPSFLTYDPAAYSTTVCKIRSYTIHVFLMMSRSCIALACVDRFALCRRHAYSRLINQYSMAIRLIVITSILWLLVPIHLLVYINIQMPSRRCGAAGLYLTVYSAYASIVTSIPLIIMIVFSYLAIRSLRLSYIRISPHINHSIENVAANERRRKRDIQWMTILIGEVIVYYLSTVWYPIYSIYFAVTINVSKSPTRSAIEDLIRYLSLGFFIYLNSCSLFYVHLLASKTFRRECRQIIFRWFKHHQSR